MRTTLLPPRHREQVVTVSMRVGHILRTDCDSRGAALAIPSAHYTDSRTAGDAATKLGFQIGVDTAADIVNEYWPDLEWKLRRGKE
jgi:hypothetical protein